MKSIGYELVQTAKYLLERSPQPLYINSTLCKRSLVPQGLYELIAYAFHAKQRDIMK